MKKFAAKIQETATRAYVKVQTFCADQSGSETTEKVGMVAVAIVIIALLVGVVNDKMGGIFESIFEKAKEALEGIFPAPGN